MEEELRQAFLLGIEDGLEKEAGFKRMGRLAKALEKNPESAGHGDALIRAAGKAVGSFKRRFGSQLKTGPGRRALERKMLKHPSNRAFLQKHTVKGDPRKVSEQFRRVSESLKRSFGEGAL